MSPKKFLFGIGVLAAFAWSAAAHSQPYDADLAWPLCGRIADNPPTGWVEFDGCPSDRWGNPDHSDLPLASPFGPRPLASENDRYDFHRGIDIATPIGTPVFAIADGVVKIAGDHPSYSDPLVQLRHFRPGHSSCADVGCYHSNYMHLSAAAVAVDAVVSKGDLIGYTGESASGFDHLHFEIRDAPSFDVFSRWQRDAIHPLGALPYQSAAVPTITFESVDTSNPNAPIVRLSVATSRVDVQRVELSVYDAAGDLVPQPGNTPDIRGYNVYPSWFDMNEWNFQYSHKDSSAFPWESFGEGGENQCPFYPDHGATYSAHVHLDAQDPFDFHVGSFNGVDIRPTKYVAGDYNLTLTFNELLGPAQCIIADVHLAAGGVANAQWGVCSGSGEPPVADDQSVATDEDQPVAITLTGSGAGSLTYAIISPPTHGSLAGTAPNLTYTPDPNYNGPDDFGFTVSDGAATSSPATVSITVRAVNDPPLANAQSVVTNKNIAVDITLTGSDVDGDLLNFAITSGPAHGTLTGTGPDRLYTPDTNYTGADSFAFSASDGLGGSDTATVSINVKKGKGGGNGGGGGKPPKGKK